MPAITPKNTAVAPKISTISTTPKMAKLGENVTIHPFAFISKNTEIGDGCTIYPYVSILNGARIGKNNKIYNGAIIAAEPQDPKWHGEPSFCYIGDNNIIRDPPRQLHKEQNASRMPSRFPCHSRLGISLHNKNLAFFRISALTVCKLSIGIKRKFLFGQKIGRM